MPPEALGELRRAVYRQKQRVTLMSQDVYGRADPGEVPEQMSELQAADDELRSLEQELADAEREARAAAAVVLDTRASANGGGSALMGRDTTGIEATVTLRMSHVPTGIVHLLREEEQPLVSVSLENARERKLRVRVTSSVEGYSAHAVSTLELPAGGKAEIRQLPTFFPASLEPVRELTRATLHAVIEDLDGKVERATSHPIWLLARTTACNRVRDPATSAWIGLEPFYAAWVTPNAPDVQALLREAASLHGSKRIVGYQGTDRGVVATQVEAMYQALKARDLTYVNSIISYGAGELEQMQRVRLPREALANRSANCIDGTVLMASILEAASMNPGLVFVPGHAFLAWETWRDSGEWEYLETTMIGTHEFADAVASGRTQAKRYHATPLSLTALRVDRGITPME